MLSVGGFEKQQGILILVTRLEFSCSLFATFRAQESEEKQTLEEIDHEDRSPYNCCHNDVGCCQSFTR
jgi:hypothetical protein